MKPPITIEQQANGFYRASSGERYQDNLCWDEALGVAAAYLHGPEEKCLEGLRTEEQHRSFDRWLGRYQDIRIQRDELLAEFRKDLAEVATINAGRLHCPVDQLDLGVRSSRCISAAGIRTISDLVRKTDKELLSIRGFGKVSLIEVTEELSRHGLHLGMGSNEASPQHNPAQSVARMNPADDPQNHDSNDD